MATSIVNTHEAKSRLSELLREVENGGEVIVARNGAPVAKLIAWPPAQFPRAPGAWTGRVVIGDDLVDSDDDIVAMFDEASGVSAS